MDMATLRHVKLLPFFLTLVFSSTTITAAPVLIDTSGAVIVDESNRTGFERLFDEQALVIDKPVDGQYVSPEEGPNTHFSGGWQTWKDPYPVSSYIDLGKEYKLSEIFLFDTYNKGDYTLSYGEPGNWTQFFTGYSGNYRRWKQVIGPEAGTRYLRYTMYSGKAHFGEIVLYGEPASLEDNPDYAHLFFNDITPERQEELDNHVLNSATQPYVGHPRLYGDDVQWSQRNVIYENLDTDCTMQGKPGWGSIPNVKSSWEKRAKGGVTCEGKAPATLADHFAAKFYINQEGKWSWDLRLQALYLIRYENNCHAMGGTCLSTPAELALLKEQFLAYEFDRLRNLAVKNGFIANWHKGYNGQFFDLGAKPPFQFWCLLLDVFWNDPTLTATDRDYVTGLLSNEIDSYIESYNTGHWSITNGNNWTAVLGEAATYWAILFYYEDPRAQDVLQMVLDSQWLTRPYFIEDGAYVEGVGYAEVMYGSLREINQLLLASFDQYLPSVPWGHLAKTSVWMLDQVATDGLIVDFGDVWAKAGFASFTPMSLVLWKEQIGLGVLGETEIDPCQARQFFANIYFEWAFYNPWTVEPAWARDWYSLVSQCVENDIPEHEVIAYPEYGYGSLKSYLPGANFTITGDQTALRYSQMDFTSFYLNAVPNFFAHREIDYGSVIWSAYGSRIFWEYGYGEISKNYDTYNIIASKGYFKKESDQDRLEFYVKTISDNMDFSKLNILIKVNWKSGELNVADYAESAIGTDWVKVSIPLVDFGIADSHWEANAGDEPWNGQGVYMVQLKVKGGFGKGYFGIDEIRLVGSQAELTWYGDSYNGSIQGSALIMNAPGNFYISQEVSSGGANSSSWLEFYNDTAGRVVGMYYSADTDERNVANLFDHSPLGANTLVIPDAYLNNDPATNVTQINGVRGTLEAETVSGMEGIHLDGSEVYGAGDTSLGWFDYFDRWAFPLEDGHFVLIDAFKLKDSRPAKDVEEFFYSIDGGDTVALDCADKNSSAHVAVTPEGSHRIHYKPKCSLIDKRNISYVEAGMTAASMQAGTFDLGAPQALQDDPYFTRFIDGNVITLLNHSKKIERRTLVRYTPAAPLKEDVRVFLMTGAAMEGDLQPSSVNYRDCGVDDACFDLVYDGIPKTVVLHKDNDHYQLQSIE